MPKSKLIHTRTMTLKRTGTFNKHVILTSTVSVASMIAFPLVEDIQLVHWFISFIVDSIAIEFSYFLRVEKQKMMTSRAPVANANFCIILTNRKGSVRIIDEEEMLIIRRGSTK